MTRNPRKGHKVLESLTKTVVLPTTKINSDRFVATDADADADAKPTPKKEKYEILSIYVRFCCFGEKKNSKLKNWRTTRKLKKA